MRSSFGLIGKTAMALALSAGVLTVGATAAVAKEKAPKEQKASNSPEFVKVAQTLQKPIADVQASKDKAAAAALLPQIVAAEATVKTPLDRIIFGQWQQQIGGILGDAALQQKGLQNMVDSGQLDAEKSKLVGFFLGMSAYQNKDYATATKVLGPLVAANYSDDSAAEVLAESYSLQGQHAQALDALKSAVSARKAAGGAVPANWFNRANLIAYNNRLGPQAIEWSTLMVENDPSPRNWLGAGQLVREFGSFTNQESLDLGRLFFRTGAFKNEAKFVSREYIEYIQAADPRRLPGEVLKVANTGVAAGMLKTSDPFVAEAISQAKGRIAPDKASLPALDRDARASKDGKSALAMADAYLSYDEAAKAEEMYGMAIAKGGIDKDRAVMRMGIAQIDQRKFTEAKASFGQVTNATRAPLARLWSAYATSQLQPKAAVPAQS